MLTPANLSILVADDHPPTRYVLSRVLRHAGFRTVEAATGAQALELAEYVSAVLLDVNLPDLHGLEVCRLLRARRNTARMPIVHMSAISHSAEQRRAAHAAGADAFMAAPIDHDLLAPMLLRLLSARR